MYLYRELYGTQRIAEDWAADIKRLSEGESIEATVADHDAEDRATLERHGIQTIAANKEISPGIQAVQARLRKAGDGRARLFVMRGALVEADTRLLDARKPIDSEQEFDVYMWPKGSDGKPMKEKPVDENNHGMDAMRYAVRYVDRGGIKVVPNPFYD
jgi:phage terminase large subunit